MTKARTNQADVAAHLDLSVRRCQHYWKAGVLPPAKPPKGYDLDEQRVAYVRYLRGVASGQTSPDGDIDLMAERARKERAQANKTEFEVAVLKREYAHISHIESVLLKWSTVAASRLDAMCAKLSQRFPDLKARHLDGIRKTVAETRNELAGYRPFTD